MEESDDYSLALQDLLGKNENSRCVDCAVEPTEFASLTYGIFLCKLCADKHVRLGEKTSLVKSLSEDWIKEDVDMMKAGGNSKFILFLNGYNIPTYSEIVYKYNTAAAKFYRENLKSEAKQELCEAKSPTMEEALKVVESSQPDESLSLTGKLKAKITNSIENGKSLLGKVTENEKIKEINEKAHGLINKVSEEIKTNTEKGKAHIEKAVEYGRDSLEWSTNYLNKDKIFSAVESSKETLLKTTEKGKETFWHGVEYSRESLEQGISASKTQILKGVEVSKETIASSAIKSKEKILQSVEVGRKKIETGLQQSKNKITESYDNLATNVDKVKNTIYENVESGKELVNNEAVKIKDTVYSKVQTGKESLESGIYKGYEKCAGEGKELSNKGANVASGFFSRIVDTVSNYANFHTCLRQREEHKSVGGLDLKIEETDFDKVDEEDEKVIWEKGKDVNFQDLDER
ncbi:hypothetical protein SteCoe_27815 [Stentor coeruleus]|uniref:Arf-GAP domain-containing protein n=1 Tax=Stentor coeruleus TaxID=5963 RepID=A0A1R2B9N6_9CILI|nr:hypothetical protein SteCoe_27815 [Stentor coeruleus]